MNRYNRLNLGGMKISPRAMAANNEYRENCKGSDEQQVLAMAYVPSQSFENLYSPTEALMKGTLFCDLDLPYTGICRRANQ